MSEPFPPGPISTRATLVSDFRRLGIGSGDIVLLHSSLRKIGWVCGGSEAVVLALLDVLGEEGTLVVPSQTSNNSEPSKWQHPPVPEAWWDIIRANTPAFNPHTSPSKGMGVIAETVRTWPGAVRSAHPQTSFAAVGPLAESLLAHHALDCALGERSPLAALERHQARILLLGVGFEACTAIHLAEYRSPAPLTKNSFAVAAANGRRWITVDDIDIDEGRFSDLGAEFEQHCWVANNLVGRAQSRLLSLPEVVAFAVRWLPANRPRS